MAKRRSYKRRRRTPAYLLAAAAVILLAELGNLFLDFGGAASTPLSQETSVHFLDVGQGDSALILSGGEAVLIDAGPTDAGDRVVQYLTDLGVTRLRAAVATHPHEDHIGGMDRVLAAFPTETLLLPNKTATTKCYERMLDAAEAGGTQVSVPAVGDSIAFSSGARLTFLSPDPAETFTEVNNYSIVSRFDAGGKRVLFMGDAEADIESALLARGADVRSDVLKVGHHGSSTSSTSAFVRRVSPAEAVISCAKNNEYGHPHRETIALLDALGVQTHITADTGAYVYRVPTDTEGANAA